MSIFKKIREDSIHQQKIKTLQHSNKLLNREEANFPPQCRIGCYIAKANKGKQIIKTQHQTRPSQCFVQEFKT